MTDYIAPYIPFAVVDPKTGMATASFQAFWKTSLQNAVAAALAAEAAQQAADAAQATADTKQPESVSLTNLAALDGTGLVEQTGVDEFTDRSIGVSDPSSIPTRGLADLRYVRAVFGPAWVDATGAPSRTAYASYAAPTISATYVQAEVQGLADQIATISTHLVAIINDLKSNRTFT